MSELGLHHDGSISFVFTQISEEFARQYEKARRMLRVSPAQSLIHLRGCGITLARIIIDDKSATRSFDELLKHAAFRTKTPAACQAWLNWLRLKGNLAAHPEQHQNNPEELTKIAIQGLRFAHNLANWYAGAFLKIYSEELGEFEVPPEGTDEMNKICGDAIVRKSPDAMYFLGKWLMDQALQARAKTQEELENGKRFALDLSSEPAERALYWFRRAESLGNIPSLFELGIAMIRGIGTEQDVDGGVALLEYAADYEDCEAQHMLGVYYLSGTIEDQKDFPKDYARAKELLEKAAASEHAGAYNCLMKIYSEGLGVPHDMEKAMSYAYRSADAGYPLGKLNLAIRYFKGSTTERHKGETVELLRAAAEANISDAYTILYEVFADGKLVERDINKALEYLHIAEKKYDVVACLYLAREYYSGRYVERNLRRVFQSIEKAEHDPRPQEEAFRNALQTIREQATMTLREVVAEELYNIVIGCESDMYARRAQDNFLLLQQITNPGLTKESTSSLEALKETMFVFPTVVTALRQCPKALDHEVMSQLLNLLPKFDYRRFRRRIQAHNKTLSPPPQKSKKVGANAPCPCGSGKKYKRCCRT